MNVEKFYGQLLGLKDGWAVESVEQNNSSETVTVKVGYRIEGSYKCPDCSKGAVYHDSREKTIRHSDTCEYKTYLIVKYPRVKCPLCGTVAIAPPFVAEDSRFTKAFERRIIQLCHSSSTQKAAKDLGLEWHVVERIKKRALKRGMARQRQRPGRTVKNITIDETSFQKYHNYSTIITDVDRGTVLAVLPERDSETLLQWFKTQHVADFSRLKSISLDMAPPYIKAVKDYFQNADKLICYDRFHVAQLFNRAVDTVRRRESADYKRGENPLAGTRFDWLRNSGKLDNRTARRKKFIELTKQPFKTAEAWRHKERASTLWDYRKGGVAKKAWRELLKGLSRSQLPELKKLRKTIGNHLAGILNAIKMRASNGIAEARNSCIQRIKRMACGFRDKARFGLEIIFQFGGLNMAF